MCFLLPNPSKAYITPNPLFSLFSTNTRHTRHIVPAVDTEVLGCSRSLLAFITLLDNETRHLIRVINVLREHYPCVEYLGGLVDWTHGRIAPELRCGGGGHQSRIPGISKCIYRLLVTAQRKIVQGE